MTPADPLPVELLCSEDARRSLDLKAKRCADRICGNVGEGGLHVLTVVGAATIPASEVQRIFGEVEG